MLVLLVVAAAVAGTGDPELLMTIGIQGYRVDGAGDVNADGYDDVIVGSYRVNGLTGIVRVCSGKDGDTLYEYSGTGQGLSVAGVGDVDKDGYADFAYGVRGGAGSVVVRAGKDGEVLFTFDGKTTGDHLGWALSGAGDVNKDGYPDILVGTHAAGYAKVYSGKDGTTLHSLTKETPGGAYFGSAVSGAGDVNGDGYDDVIVGDPFYYSGTSNYGSAYVISGKDGKALHKLYGQQGDSLGWDVAGLGDLNDDGYDDFAVGVVVEFTAVNQGPGRVLVCSGKDGKTLLTLTGDAHGDLFAVSVGCVGDINGDGVPDIAVGAAADDDNGKDCGSVRVFSGEDGEALFTLYGDQGAQFGFSVRGAGDVSGDGAPDFIVGGDKASHVYGIPAPTGTVTIDSGAEATNSTSVGLTLTWRKADAEVADMRLRNSGGSWGDWITLASTKSWTLAPGEGTKTVEAEFRDADGKTSAVANDAIILDQTPPIGTVRINYGAAITPTPWVTLQLEYTDLLSGVTDVRLRNEGAAWSPWEYVDATKPWTIPQVAGLRTVEVQYRDAAGNVSAIAADSIEYVPDIVAPKITTVRICDNWLYVCPEEEFRVLVHALDNAGGSGLDAFRVKLSTESTWSDWFSYDQGPDVVLPHPTRAGRVTVRAVVRDVMGNESTSEDATAYFLRPTPSWLGSGGKASGSVSTVREIDAFTLGLVMGDTLTVKPQTKAGEKKKVLVLDLDVVSPKLKVKVRQAKANKKGVVEVTGTEIQFDAVAGSKFKASLSGEGIDPAGVTLIGPDGPVPIEISGKPGKVKIKGVVLTAGTGTYVIRLATSATFSAKWSVKLPKIKGTLRE